MEVGCLRHPGASIIGSQLLDEDCFLPWLANPSDPAMSSHAARGTGTCHTFEIDERGRENGWEGNCPGDELPLQKHLQYIRHAMIRENLEFRHVPTPTLLTTRGI